MSKKQTGWAKPSKRAARVTGAVTGTSKIGSAEVVQRTSETQRVDLGGLPEISDAAAEILAGQVEPCSVSFLVDPTRPNDPINHTGGVKADKGPAKKPAMLTDAAEMVRKGFLDAAHKSVETVKSGGFNHDAFKAAQKELRRVKIVARYQSIESDFAGREANSVDADELRTHIEAKLAALPAEAGDDMFASDANKFVSLRQQDVQWILRDLFRGCYNISLDDVLRKTVEVECPRDHRSHYGLKADGDPMNCNFRTDVESGKECAVRFIPLAWRDHGNWVGHFLIRKMDEKTNQKIAFCRWHTSMARKDGAQMLSQRDADRALGVIQHKEEELKATKANLADIANVKLVDGRIVTNAQPSRDDRRPNNGGGDITDVQKKSASRSLSDFRAGVPGQYFFKHPTWEVRGEGGFTVATGAQVLIDSDGKEAKIIGRKNDFGKMIGELFPIDNPPKKLIAFLVEYRNINRTD